MQFTEALNAARSSTRGFVLKRMGLDPIVVEYDYGLGMPIVNYGNRLKVAIGRRINPLHLSLYACKALGLEHITGPILVPRLRETETREYVQRVVDWLLSTQKNRGACSVWDYDFPWPSALLEPPWNSGLAEAFGALVLLEAGRRNNARRHLQSMLTDFTEGGVAWYSKDSLWFLEYPSVKPLLVLNCMLHCLLILRECAERLRNRSLERGFSLAYRTLKRDIGLFDASFYTYYDSLRNPADQKYHQIHLTLLRMLYERTGDSYFLPWISRWEEYRKWYAVVEPVVFAGHVLRMGGPLYNRQGNVVRS